MFSAIVRYLRVLERSKVCLRNDNGRGHVADVLNNNGVKLEIDTGANKREGIVTAEKAIIGVSKG